MVKVENNLPDTSRVWVYQSNRRLTDHEVSVLKEQFVHFTDDWKAHGKKLNSAVEIYYHHFIVIFVDESFQEATGCSIDKSVAYIQSVQEKFGIDLLDRMNLAYKTGDKIISIKMADFQRKAQSGEFQSDMIVFNNLVTSKGEFLENWETSAENSWHSNLF